LKPPKKGCIAPFKEYIDDNFGFWGGVLASSATILYTLLGFSCCLHRKDLFSAEDTNKVSFINQTD
jgi:hypothetical protein